MRWWTRVALLVALWLLAWGDLSLANVLSGAALAYVLLVAFPPVRRRVGAPRVRLVGVARLVAHVARQLVVSNAVMAVQILRPRLQTRPGVLAHHLQEPSEEIVTIMTSVISLSPGTMTADVADDSSVVYVHFFDLQDIDAARASLVELEALARATLTDEREGSAP